MKLKILLPIVILGAFILAPSTADAQFKKTWKSWYGHVQGGYSMVQGDLDNVLKDGWNISGGATYKPKDWLLGVTMELGYNDFNMTSEALDFFESSGGDASITSLTIGGIWAPNLNGKIGFSLQAGIGGYYVRGQLTEPAYVCGPICNPYYWWCWWGCTPGSVITDSVSSTEFGYNLGAAITFELENDSVIYLEAKYHWVDTQTTAKFMPISIGYRW